MLLYIMLYIVLAYLMLFAALTNTVCLNNASYFLSLICANAFYFHALSLFISFFLFASCTVLLICLFFLIICSHRCCCFCVCVCFFFVFFFNINIFYERAMSCPEK